MSAPPRRLTVATAARTGLLVLGAGALGVQLVFLREVLSTFGGNELVAGLALGIWLLATGLGSLWGGRIASRCPPRVAAAAAAHVVLALLPLAMLAGIRAVPLLSGVRGQLCDLRTELLGCLVVFLPFGLISGGMIPLLGSLMGLSKDIAAAPHDSRLTGRVYFLDTLGSAVGGLLFSLFLVSLLSHGWSLAVFGALHLLAAAVLLRARSRRKAFLFLIGLAAFPLLAAGKLDVRTLSWRFPGQAIVASRNTPFAQIVITRTGRQWNVFQDALPLYSTGDLAAESRVHPALAQVPEGAGVLLLGGGVFGNLRESLLHAPGRIDYVELDRAILELGETVNAPSSPAGEEERADPEPGPGGGRRPIPRTGAEELLEDPRVHSHIGDARSFLRKRPGAYDAIVMNLPGPENAQLNRFYTREFFSLLRRSLRSGGVFSFSLASSPNYLGPEQLALERSIYAALSASFPHIIVLPGETHIYLASDRPIDLDLPSILAARGIETRRLLDYDWPELSDPFRIDELAALLAGEASPAGAPFAPNSDLSPRAFGHLLAREARKTGAGRGWIAALTAISLLLTLAASGRSSARLVVATSGIAGMSTELLLLLIDQIRFGHLYQRLSLFVTLFLIGAAAGAALYPRVSSGRRPSSPRRWLMATELCLIALCGAIWGLGKWEGTPAGEAAADGLFHLLHPALLVLVALILGMQFAAAGKILERREQRDHDRPSLETPTRTGTESASAGSVIGRLYLSDLAGAASGTILTGLVLLPACGVGGVIIAVVAVKLISLLRLLLG